MSGAAALSLRERFEGKWQIPALFVAVALLVGSLLRLNAQVETGAFPSRLARLSAQVEDGYYTSALDYGKYLIDGDDVSAADRAEAHRLLGRARYLRAVRAEQTGAAEADAIQEEYAAMARWGAAPAALDLAYLGDTHAWQGDHARAVADYQRAVEESEGPALDLRRRIIELARYELAYAPDDLLSWVDAFADDAMDDMEHLRWAAATRIDLLAALDRQEEALAFLEVVRPRFSSPPWEDAHEYLTSLALYRTGRYDEAEGRLRSLRNRLSMWDELYARSGLLLGRVVLSDGSPQRPAEALSFFRDVISAAPGTVYEHAGRVGTAESLAALERFGESLDQYRQVVDGLAEFPRSAVLTPDMVRASATVVAETLRRAGRLEAPLQYYEIAVGLVDEREPDRLSDYLQILGDLRAALARDLRARAKALPAGPEVPSSEIRAPGSGPHVSRSDPEQMLLDEARHLLLEAGSAFLELARLNTLNEARSAEGAWRAADLFDEAGDTERAIAVLEQFARERPEHPLVPRVLLRLGQARQALGRYTGAVEAYRENLRRFPRTPDAGSGLIPLARCYMALGGDENNGLAEKTLVDYILGDSEVYTPAAPEFRDALFLLGDLYNAEERFEQSVGVLEEALERYPDDIRATGAKFLLANAYRRSALALKEDITKTEKASEWPRMRDEMRGRLERAADLFAELIAALEARGEDASGPLERQSLAHSRLYRADCLYELGRFAEAVALYETAAFMYRGEPTTLSAYVQVINCRLSMGQLPEAQAALRRAQYLLRIMPDRAFEEDYVGQDREEWDRFLNWIASTKLLGDKTRKAGANERSQAVNR